MPPTFNSRARRPLLALIALLALLVIGYTAQAVNHHSSSTHTSSSPASDSANAATTRSGANTGVALSTLPAEARRTVALIQKGGPYPYSRDGIVFQNAEHHLPAHKSGYYHEYTVTTPGESDRGARRIITGQDGEFYYTADHYETFQRVDVTR